MNVNQPVSNIEGKEINVALSSYEWHQLMRELEHLLSICNRDNSTCTQLYEKIASQLAGKPVRLMIGKSKT